MQSRVGWGRKQRLAVLGDRPASPAPRSLSGNAALPPSHVHLGVTPGEYGLFFTCLCTRSPAGEFRVLRTGARGTPWQ